MKVLVATSEMQGQRDNDFNWCDEGELVTFGDSIHDREEVDGNCGCRRSMAGIRTWRSTTTFKVAESELTKNEYISHVVDTKNKQGWQGCIERWMPEIDVLLSIAKAYSEGTILEKRGDMIQTRQKQVDLIQLQMEV